MANIKNLKSNSERTPKERRELAKKAGKKSGEARRERKTLREELLLMLETGDTRNKITLAMIEEAAKGNVKAYLAIRDTVGEKPIDKTEISGNDMFMPTVLICESELNDPIKLKDKLATSKGCQIEYISSEEEKEYEEHIKRVVGEW